MGYGHRAAARIARSRLLSTTAAVAAGLLSSVAATAQEATPSPAQTLPGTSSTPTAGSTGVQPGEGEDNPVPGQGDIVVTASRRAETVTKLPFNISAYGGDQLRSANITSVSSLTQQVPNFAIEDRGARATASAIPIIRGLNASQPTVGSARFFQSPVGLYQGNAPITGAFPLYDIQRIEVLRGPQGTLYGAGSLSGAVRIVPEDPRFDQVSGYVSASGSVLAHSRQVGYALDGAVNLPLSDTLALRVSGRYAFEPGFIDQYDILRRGSNDYAAGVPILADAADVAGSRGVYFDKKDVNTADTTALRAALKWKPTSELTLQASYSLSYVEGNGAPIDNPTFEGGASPLDPRVTLSARGEYERSSPTLEPFSRRSQLVTLDASYDAGFATISSTLAYGTTRGEVVTDTTQNLLGSAYGFYYVGSPANPRSIIPVANPDRDKVFSEELRLVSNPGGTFDYILGAFFQQQDRSIGLIVYDPGADAQSSAANGGSTTPIAAGGTYVTLFPDQSSYYQFNPQRFRDYSAYGELTAHISDTWQVTGGARVFHQTFSQEQHAASSFFFFKIDDVQSSSVTSQIFKVNTSYKFNDRNQVYATWSQGFRRGGANAFATSGPVSEPTSLVTYVPDKTNNFEVGVKGTIAGIYYSADLFYIDWNKPQIDLLTPYNLTAVVVNGDKASSKGAEIEMSGRLFADGLTFNLGLAYAKARLTKDFSLPAGNGLGEVVQDAIHGSKGDRLPGAPDFSGSATINYTSTLGADAKLTYSLGADFRSSTVNQLPSFSANTPPIYSPGYALFRGNVTFETGDWTLQLYGTNLFDKRAQISANPRTLTSYALLGDFANAYVISRPREVGLRMTRRF